jgi:hypothetical protein
MDQRFILDSDRDAFVANVMRLPIARILQKSKTVNVEQLDMITAQYVRTGHQKARWWPHGQRIK